MSHIENETERDCASEDLMQIALEYRSKLKSSMDCAGGMFEANMQCISHILHLEMERESMKSESFSKEQMLSMRINNLLDIVSSQQKSIDEMASAATLRGMWRSLLSVKPNSNQVVGNRSHAATSDNDNSSRYGLSPDDTAAALSWLSACCAADVSASLGLTHTAAPTASADEASESVDGVGTSISSLFLPLSNSSPAAALAGSVMESTPYNGPSLPPRHQGDANISSPVSGRFLKHLLDAVCRLEHEIVHRNSALQSENDEMKKRLQQMERQLMDGQDTISSLTRSHGYQLSRWQYENMILKKLLVASSPTGVATTTTATNDFSNEAAIDFAAMISSSVSNNPSPSNPPLGRGMLVDGVPTVRSNIPLSSLSTEAQTSESDLTKQIDPMTPLITSRLLQPKRSIFRPNYRSKSPFNRNGQSVCAWYVPVDIPRVQQQQQQLGKEMRLTSAMDDGSHRGRAICVVSPTGQEQQQRNINDNNDNNTRSSSRSSSRRRRGEAKREDSVPTSNQSLRPSSQKRTPTSTINITNRSHPATDVIDGENDLPYYSRSDLEDIWASKLRVYQQRSIEPAIRKNETVMKELREVDGISEVHGIIATGSCRREHQDSGDDKVGQSTPSQAFNNNEVDGSESFFYSISAIDSPGTICESGSSFHFPSSTRRSSTTGTRSTARSGRTDNEILEAEAEAASSHLFSTTGYPPNSQALDVLNRQTLAAGEGGGGSRSLGSRFMATASALQAEPMVPLFPSKQQQQPAHSVGVRAESISSGVHVISDDDRMKKSDDNNINNTTARTAAGRYMMSEETVEASDRNNIVTANKKRNKINSTHHLMLTRREAREAIRVIEQMAE